jgi:large subunit GTPase 1
VLCGEKKVNVSMTPGKTKHLQTIKLSDQILLCDCPGLVFPSFLTTKADMICSGLLPIDHMRDPRPPTALVCNPFHRTRNRTRATTHAQLQSEHFR